MLALSDAAQAQNRRVNWNRGSTKAQVERIVSRVENQSDRFVATFDRGLDRSNLDGTLREDRLNERARELESDLNALRQEFDRTDRYQDTRQQVSRVLTTAEGINTVVRRRRLPNATERQWSRLRSELNALAAIFNLRQLRQAKGASARRDTRGGAKEVNPSRPFAFLFARPTGSRRPRRRPP